MYLLKITPAAENDLDKIYAYISDIFFDNSAAKKIILRIEDSIMSLCHYPYRCEISRDEMLALKGYRRLVVGNYVVIYTIDELNKIVVIMRIFHGEMDYAKYI